MNNKVYKSISEVSNILKINKHVIRYWDSKFEGISTRLSNKKRRFFSKENIERLQKLKNVLYQNGKHNYSLDLANKIVTKRTNQKIYNKENPDNNNLKINKLREISSNLKKLLKS
ncbi:MAG: hypothetical protein CFH18_00948 [Alphaproteobacteria bacterium MarineAlpha5_Bin8]|nr:MAG: hypothetical protein CFH18_00948 [Alphaproteobacteria bacterium MarineAlpha5_Bin8]PPR45894.1 MAG: hypothetical protein CFH17_00339 [Alphaproteobacteria bacterium MarineAlpha5_Bin7]PPR53158.1 MAG: hypothetical protein CFH16_01155 [Alphaproteobacteria bacterium MarineAlpha5_Bin6]|tara:strand:- start:1580 stop:1924 length:345 start_codon:yes stop_codon:yes gene_type:complete